MTAPRDGHGGSHFVALLNDERIEPMSGPPVLRVGRHTIDIDLGVFPPGEALDDRAALAALIDAASPVALSPYQRDFLVGVLAERLREQLQPSSFRGVRLGLLSAFAPGYPYKARHKPRRLRKVAR